MPRFLQRSCREVTQLVLAGEDRRLGVFERMLLRSHLRVCQACPRFVAQVDLMRGAMARWRGYREPPDDGSNV